MRGAANTKITILRGTETNGFGDEVDSPVAVHTDVLASITERNRRVYLPAEGATRVVRESYCRVGYEADLRKGDRIKDQRSGLIYVITELAEPSDIAGHKMDRTATISRTN